MKKLFRLFRRRLSSDRYFLPSHPQHVGTVEQLRFWHQWRGAHYG